MQVGGALGLAVLATLSTSHSNALLSQGRSTAVALTGGYHLAFWIAAGLVTAALVAALTLLRPATKAADANVRHARAARACSEAA